MNQLLEVLTGFPAAAAIYAVITVAVRLRTRRDTRRQAAEVKS